MTTQSDWDLQRRIDVIIEKHTYKGQFKLSSGATSDFYVDCRAAMLEDGMLFYQYFSNKIQGLTSEKKIPVTVKVYPVGTGASGALILGLLMRQGYIWKDKPYGLDWSPAPEPGTNVILVDGIITTGGTLDRLTAACLEKKLSILGTVVIRSRSA